MFVLQQKILCCFLLQKKVIKNTKIHFIKYLKPYMVLYFIQLIQFIQIINLEIRRLNR